MPDNYLLIPNCARETFRRLLKEYQNYPQELVRGENFIVSRISIHAMPTFSEFTAEFTYVDGVTGVIDRKITSGSAEAAAQLEDKASFYRDNVHLGSTRTFKVINPDIPFRIIESEVADREAFADYLTGIAHLGAYCDKVGMKGLEEQLAAALRYAASVATVTIFCLRGEDPEIVTRCQDIILDPLPRHEVLPLQSIEIRYAGQT